MALDTIIYGSADTVVTLMNSYMMTNGDRVDIYVRSNGIINTYFKIGEQEYNYTFYAS